MTSYAENQTLEWRLPRLLTAPAIENWVAAIPTTTKTVVLRLGLWERTGPFADARLQGALCLLHRNGVETIVSVPPLTLRGGRAEDAFRDPDPLQPRGPLTPTERRLAGSVAGLSVGQLCGFDEEHSHIPELQRKALTKRRHLFGWGAELALVVPVEDQPTGIPRRSAQDREAVFSNRLGDLLRPLGISPKNVPPNTMRWFSALKTFAFEASENTWDHGQLDFDVRPIRSLRFVRLRRIDIGDRGFDIREVAPGFDEPFAKYLASLAEAHDLPSLWDQEGGRLVEVTVADGGVGIAARMAGGFDIFKGALESEIRHLSNALLPDRTTKSPSESGRGQGFRKMLRACFQLSGLTIVRTGRLRVSRTYRRPDGSRERVDFKDTSSEAYTPDVNNTPLPLLAGTSISLIFPIDRRGGAQGSE